jgi:beta-xylosidase
MKTLHLLILALLLLSGCKKNGDVYIFTSFREPATDGLRMLYSTDGYSWTDLDTVLLKPEIGTQKVLRDPSIAQGPDGTFHVVWTSSWRGDLGFGYSSSKDLINWTPQRFIPVMAHDTSTVNVWAPEVFYDDDTKLFVIVWASTVPHKFEKGAEDELNNHRLYYTTTQDFMSFSMSKLFFDPGYSVIDATIVKRKRHDYVLVFKDNTRPMRNLKVAFGKSVLGPWENISEPITPAEWGFCEGPTVAKVNDDFLVYFDAYTQKFFGAVKTTDFKNFESVTPQITLPEGHKHGTIIKVKQSVLDRLVQW